MAKYIREKTNDDGWTRWVRPVIQGYRMSCCDCGLVHVMDFRVRDGVPEFRARRDGRATGQTRRHMPKRSG